MAYMERLGLILDDKQQPSSHSDEARGVTEVMHQGSVAALDRGMAPSHPTPSLRSGASERKVYRSP